MRFLTNVDCYGLMTSNTPPGMQVIAELKSIDADVLGLQEIDIGCERSGSVDTGEAHRE